MTATYSGDTNYASSVGTQSITVVQPAATTLTLATSVPYAQAGTPFTLSATIASGSAFGAFSGTVAFVIDGAMMTAPIVNSVAQLPLTLALGPHTITATFSGNSYYLASTGTLPLQVYPAGTSAIKLTIVSPTGTITYGQPVMVSTTTTTGASTATPTGTIVFAVDGTVLTTTNYAASSTTTLSLPGGTHTLSATYSGDKNYEPAMATLSLHHRQSHAHAELQVIPNASAGSTPAMSANNLALAVTVGSTSTVPTGTVVLTSGNHQDQHGDADRRDGEQLHVEQRLRDVQLYRGVQAATPTSCRQPLRFRLRRALCSRR